MIQDILPRHFHNEYDAQKKPRCGDYLLCVQGGSILTRSCEPIFPKAGEIPLSQDPVYLFSIDETAYFLPLACPQTPPEGFCYEPVKALRRRREVPDYQVFAAFTADHLSSWYHSNHFCGSCGQPMVLGEDERRLDCPACGHRVYPRINPAVIVGVISGERLLITHYARNRGVSVPALVAGFCEIGETFEDTVRREVAEEVGLKVKNIRYYKSQPWGIADDLLAGFYCEVDQAEEVTLDTGELADATWTRREAILGQPDSLSLTNEMMLRFRDGRENERVLS